jgi:light-regulated signal transduction histidine kinase (bacteriophytochrome)
VAALRADAPDRVIEWTIGDLPPAWGDPVLIEQVFANLVGNAVKYTGTRERARIEIGCDDDEHPTYFVRDDGVGFDMSKAHRLFQVFERLHYADEFDGNGIGLATVERIVTKHGGTVRAESMVGQGATFRFDLPPR